MHSESSLPSYAKPINTPRHVDVLDVPLALTDYRRTIEWIDDAVRANLRGYVCVCNVHTVMAYQEDDELRAAMERSSLHVPDGQPLVWAINALGNILADRVYVLELMAQACAHAAET